MGISFSIPCDPCTNKVFHWLDEKVACTHNLKKNITALEKTMGELKAKRDDLLRRITREEDRGMQRLAGIQVWLNKVETIENETILLRTTRDAELQKLCLCGFCSKSLISSHLYGKRVSVALREVEKLKSDDFNDVADQPQTSVVQERQLQERVIFGQETMLDKAWNYLMDDGVGLMGMYGMGGVGKTTLLIQLHNKLSGVKHAFDFVIWVVVSKELSVEKILDEIAYKVGLERKEWKLKKKNQKVDVIYNFLRKKRFVLFLDDIWEKVKLADIGVPFPTPQNKCKVVLTTRSQDVCAQMEIEDPMEVKCLAEDVAFDLFQKKVGKRALGSDPEIPELAKIVAGKCRGLPLALNIIGETMSGMRKKEEWLHAIDVLNSYASEFSGVDKILSLLKYSYDHLKGDELKSCLLYCALFPEDYKSLKERLIEYWIGEGIIDGSEGIEKAENKGYAIIGSLVCASLLTEGVDWNNADVVSMHDVVREMALWIASDLGNQKEAFVVRAGVGLHGMPQVKNWGIVEKMSWMENDIQDLTGVPECHQLTTFLLRNTNLNYISKDFFSFMSKLAVLDLSGNEELSGLPDGLSELVSLQYLNLSSTGMRHLPVGVLGLKKLIHLNLEYTEISLAGISHLRNLKVLKLDDESTFSWDLEIVRELNTLEHLEVVTLKMYFSNLLKQYLSSHRLTSCTRELRMSSITDMDLESSISLPINMEKLREFNVRYCKISEIKMVHNPRTPCFLSLSKVFIVGCDYLRELTFLMFAPKLLHLFVEDSDGLKDVINKEKAREGEESGIVPFQRLISLTLSCLYELKSIYWRPLLFPRLENIKVDQCHKLKKLPLDSQSGTNGLIINYTQKRWIENVEWEDKDTKTRFLRLCKQV